MERRLRSFATIWVRAVACVGVCAVWAEIFLAGFGESCAANCGYKSAYYSSITTWSWSRSWRWGFVNDAEGQWGHDYDSTQRCTERGFKTSRVGESSANFISVDLHARMADIRQGAGNRRGHLPYVK